MSQENTHNSVHNYMLVKINHCAFEKGGGGMDIKIENSESEFQTMTLYCFTPVLSCSSQRGFFGINRYES